MKKPALSLSLTLSFLFILMFGNSCILQNDPVRIEELRCEYLVNPLGVDVPQPGFSWIITSSRRDVSQTAYEIVVTGPGGETLWDSGKVLSDQTTGIVYHGEPLSGSTRYTWKVTVWDDLDRQIHSGETAWFQTGMLKSSDWKARWIAADTAVSAPLLRKAFAVDKQVKYAWVYVSALGNIEPYLNGEKVGDHVMDPGRTDFRKSLLYATYDVTDQLNMGENVIGVMLGNGTYRVWNVRGRYGWIGDHPRLNAPKAFLQLEIYYTNGSKKIWVTDGSWKSSPGPITFNHVYGGEDYDARLEQPGWSSPGFNDSAWENVDIYDDPGIILRSQMMPPMKVMNTLQPVAGIQPEPGIWLFDMGQNFAGWWQIRVRGREGVTLRVRGAETLNDSLFPAPLKPGDRLSTNHDYHTKVWTDYTLKGDGQEIYEPRFFYTGYRYVEVTTDQPEKLDSLYVVGRVVHTAFEKAGSFESSDSLLNRIWRAAVWSQNGNLHSVPTDCPHREKGAYTGDGEVIAETSIHDFRMTAFYRKWMNDMRDSQFENGRVPNTSPTLIGGYGGGIAWGSAYILVPWWMYQYYLDKPVLEEHYVTMKRYLAYLYTLARNDANPSQPFIINAFGGYWDSLGEWCAPEERDGPNHPVVSTAYYYLDTRTLSKIAGILGHQEDANRYAALADTIKEAFNQTFYDSRTKLYGTDSLYQTYQVLALALDLVPAADREKVFQDLVSDIMVDHQGHLNTGILGTKYLWPVLAHGGRDNVAYTIATGTTFPGYGYWITNGATTLWEQWDARHSHNHQMFGTVSEFFYKYLAGIRSPMDGGTTTGYKHIHIQPFMPEEMSFAHASVNTIRGEIVSSWQRTEDGIQLHVVIPANCDASVNLPIRESKDIVVMVNDRTVWENNLFVKGSEGIAGAEAGNGFITLSTGSGVYDFVLRYP